MAQLYAFRPSSVLVFSRKWGQGCVHSDSLLANPWIALSQLSLSTQTPLEKCKQGVSAEVYRAELKCEYTAVPGSSFRP